MTIANPSVYDVIIIGGGPGGAMSGLETLAALEHEMLSWAAAGRWFARVHALGRRARPITPPVLECRGIRLDTQRREVSLYRGALPETSSAALAAQLLGHDTRPSEAAIRAERKIRLQEALNSMDPLDREILVLRHYEQMTNGDAAAALSLDKSAASKRYTRALERLKEVLAALPGESRES